MTSVTKLDELVIVGGGLLAGFQQGLVKNLQNDLESLLEDARASLQVSNAKLCPLLYRESVVRLDQQESNGEDKLTSSCYQESEVTEFAILMGMIYGMVKQVMVMQDKIVTSVNLKSSFGELDKYCLMWSLRPYIEDQVMHLAWELVP